MSVGAIAVELPATSFRRRIRARADRYPARPAERWLLRIALAMPYVLIAVIADARGIASTTNLTLDAVGARIDWGADDLSFVSDVYPPIPTILASILPAGAVWQGVLGALCAGIVLQLLAERVLQRGVSLGLAALLIASVGATPPFIYLATQDLVAFVGLAMFAVALSGLLRFAVDGDTEGGFQCGLALGVAAMCDPATILFAACMAMAAPLIAWRRYRGQPGAALATVIIVTFPTAAAIAGWAFVEWRFTGSAFHSLRAGDDFLAFPGGWWATVERELREMGTRIIVTPVFVVAAVLIAVRRPTALGAQVLALIAILLSKVLGFNMGTGQGYVILAFVGVITVEAAPRSAVKWTLVVAAVGQVVAQWAWFATELPGHEFVRQLVS